MKRLIYFSLWAAGGLVLVTAGLLLPAHFRTLDERVLLQAGRNTESALDAALGQLRVEKPGPARMLWRAAQLAGIANHERTAVQLAQFGRGHPQLSALGSSHLILETLLPAPLPSGFLSVADLLVPLDARTRLLTALRASRRPGVQIILQARELTNTVQLPPVASPSGQVLDLVILTTALLSQDDHLSTSFRSQLEALIQTAVQGGPVEPLENIFVDVLSLLRRLDWGQLSELMARIEETSSLASFANAARHWEASFPYVYAAALVGGRSAPIHQLITRRGEEALQDLRTSLRGGAGSVRLLLDTQLPLHRGEVKSKFIEYDPFGAYFYWTIPMVLATPTLALVAKCALLALGSAFLAWSLRIFAQPVLAAGRVEGIARWIPDAVFTGILTTMVFAFSEPNLLTKTPAFTFPFRLKIPISDGPIATNIQRTLEPIMSIVTLASLLSFFIIQALVYIWCLMKLSEIRRQPFAPPVKIKLLENEEHLFDAGLYLGFVGTVVSLILVSMGIVKASMMAAYSSTSFGIIFVSILKIFHIRPLRRQLILESHNQS